MCAVVQFLIPTNQARRGLMKRSIYAKVSKPHLHAQKTNLSALRNSTDRYLPVAEQKTLAEFMRTGGHHLRGSTSCMLGIGPFSQRLLRTFLVRLLMNPLEENGHRLFILNIRV